LAFHVKNYTLTERVSRLTKQDIGDFYQNSLNTLQHFNQQLVKVTKKVLIAADIVNGILSKFTKMYKAKT